MAKIFLLVICMSTLGFSKQGPLKPRVRNFLEIPDNFKTLRLNIGATHFAFETKYENGLFLFDLKKNTYKKIIADPVFGNYVWSWDSENLFFAQTKKKDKQRISFIYALHVRSGSKVLIDKIPGPISKVVFHQKSQTLSFLTRTGPLSILTSGKKSYAEKGPWIVTEKMILRKDPYGKYEPVFQGDEIVSFDFNREQNSIVWGTEKGLVYKISQKEKQPTILGQGKFPSFHPFLDLILVSKARMHGNQVRDNDLALFELNGKSAYITNTQGQAENWATWHPDGTKVLYAKSGSTKLELLDFKM